jgi:hypothetical protein
MVPPVKPIDWHIAVPLKDVEPKILLLLKEHVGAYIIAETEFASIPVICIVAGVVVGGTM